MDSYLEKRKNPRLKAHQDNVSIEIPHAGEPKKIIAEVLDVNEYGLSFITQGSGEDFIPGTLLKNIVLLNGNRSSSISGEVLYVMGLDEAKSASRIGIKFKVDPSNFFSDRRSKANSISFPDRRNSDRRKFNRLVERERRKFIPKTDKQDQNGKHSTSLFEASLISKDF